MKDLDAPRMPFEPGDDIISILRSHASRAPDRTALIDESTTLTRGELVARIDAVASALLADGFTKASRVAVLDKNTREYVEVFLGALAAGASVVPLPTMASPATLRAMLLDSGVGALFAAAEYGDLAAEALDDPRLDGVARFGLDFGAGGVRDFGEWSTAARSAGEPPSIDGTDEFDVMYSSGTTGVPKGIVHSHVVRKASYRGSRAAYFDERAVNVVATPFYSNTTCVTWLLTLAAGGSNVLLRKFDAEAFLDIVERRRATHAMLVPVQHERILVADSLPRRDTSSLTHLFSTSAPLRAETKRALLSSFRAELVEIYGLTEGGVVTTLVARADQTKLATVGRATAGCDLRVVDDAGRELPALRAGEVVGRSSSIMCGYLNRPADTEALVWRDQAGQLFLRSGDVGMLDSDGYLHLLDRKKDVIISGGFNVYATDLEVELLAHPAVREVAVIGIPSERWGETPLALVVLEPNEDTTSGAILTWCNERLGKAQRLGGLELRDELPKSAIGKVLKRELRAPYWAAHKS